MDNTLIIRIAVAIVLFAHSIPVILNGGVNDFGNLYLNEIGFAPFGLYIASHVACAILLLLKKNIELASFVTIFILVCGIILIHYQEGWFVVGLGRNGMEFNVLVIFVLVSIVYQNRRNSIIK